MKDQDDHFSIPHHATNNLFLRFIANHIFNPISYFFLHLYLKWGTTYEFDIEKFKQNKELLDRLGSDYDENGIPYWEKTGTVDPDYLTPEEMQKYYGVYNKEDLDRID